MRYFVLIALLAGIFSCTKEISPIPIFKIVPSPVDTIFPGEYLPLYPGSWWRYKNRNGDTLLSKVSNNWVLANFPFYHNKTDLPFYFTGYHYVVTWATPTAHTKIIYQQNIKNYVIPDTSFFYGYLQKFNQSYIYIRDTTVLIPYLWEEKRQWFIYEETYNGTNLYQGETVQLDTTIVWNNISYKNVLVVNLLNNNSIWVKKYFQKNVGQILLVENFQNGDTLELIDYFINK